MLLVTPRILIVNDGVDRSGALAARLRWRGAEVAVAPLAEIAFDSRSPSGLALPGTWQALPDAVLVRSISAGSFEAITRRLAVLHALARLGVPVWNSARAIERCVDKSMTTFLLQLAGLPTPATFAVEGRAAAEAIAERELGTGPLVLKPLFGAQGRGLRLIQALDDLPEPEEIGDVYYLQRYVRRPGPPFRDYRVFVCAGEAVAMMSRRGDHWITNVNQGAVPEGISARHNEGLSSLAVAATAAVGASFAGVDIIRQADGGLLVLEVNSMPAWAGLQSVVSVDIADVIAASLLKSLGERTQTVGSAPLARASTGTP